MVLAITGFSCSEDNMKNIDEQYQQLMFLVPHKKGINNNWEVTYSATLRSQRLWVMVKFIRKTNSIRN